MFREQGKFIRDYLRIAELNPLYFACTFFTSIFAKAAAITRPFIAALIIKALTEQNASDTYMYIGIFAIVYVFYRAMLFLNWRALTHNMIYSYQNLQERVFDKLLLVDQSFTKKISRGKLLNVINTDLFEIGEMNDEVVGFFTTTIELVAVAIIAFRFNIIVSLLMVASILVYAVIRTTKDRRFNFFWWKCQLEDDRFSSFINQILTGLQEVKVFNMLSRLHGHLDRIQSRYSKNYINQRKQETVRDNDVYYTVYAFRVLIFIACLVSMLNGHMEIDILIMLVAYHEQIIGCAGTLIDTSVKIRLTNAAVRRLNSVLNYRATAQTEYGNLELDHISGALSMKNVSLDINHQKILKNISFNIHPHEVVAIVGYPGSGKTKLFDLILRLYKPTHGKISLDNININEFSRDVYASNVTVANQVPFIFNTSIRKNLGLVDPDIKHQIEACKTAGIHNFIETLPLGYNTILRENGGNISGGQRQMISIARTLLTNAEVFLLDDISTSLDPDTAKLVPRLIKNIRKNHTIIIITKKPELMKIADRIIVLDQGKIVASGTHGGLLKRSALYRALQVMESSGGNL